MACWGSDAPQGCSKSPHQGCLEVPKREKRERAQPLTWVKAFQAWRGWGRAFSGSQSVGCCSMGTGIMETPEAMWSLPDHLQAPCPCPDCSIQQSKITAGHTGSHLHVRTGPSCASGGCNGQIQHSQLSAETRR